MTGMEVTLPGGLELNGEIVRRARFKELTGEIEFALADLDSLLSRPVYALQALSATLDSIGSQAADLEMVRSLSAADSQYLMLRLAAMLSGELQWLKVTCSHCQSFFDVDFRRCDLPVKEAPAGYPYTSLALDAGEVHLKVPTVADQMAVSGLSEHEALFTLLEKCILSVNHESPSRSLIENLSESDINRIDIALDEFSPAVCNELYVACPECGTEQTTKLDHYLLNSLDSSGFFQEIHTLALYYHWSEADILHLTRSRRHKYISLIDRSRAMDG